MRQRLADPRQVVELATLLGGDDLAIDPRLVGAAGHVIFSVTPRHASTRRGDVVRHAEPLEQALGPDLLLTVFVQRRLAPGDG